MTDDFEIVINWSDENNTHVELVRMQTLSRTTRRVYPADMAAIAAALEQIHGQDDKPT